jgi:hypothetical protein
VSGIQNSSGLTQEFIDLSTVVNPVQSTTEFKLELVAESPVSITIYDTAGRIVDRPINSIMAAGTHLIELCSLSPGTYFCQAVAENHSVTIKIAVLGR